MRNFEEQVAMKQKNEIWIIQKGKSIFSFSNIHFCNKIFLSFLVLLSTFNTYYFKKEKSFHGPRSSRKISEKSHFRLRQSLYGFLNFDGDDAPISLLRETAAAAKIVFVVAGNFLRTPPPPSPFSRRKVHGCLLLLLL